MHERFNSPVVEEARMRLPTSVLFNNASGQTAFTRFSG
jgi:hypothetical protein